MSRVRDRWTVVGVVEDIARGLRALSERAVGRSAEAIAVEIGVPDGVRVDRDVCVVAIGVVEDVARGLRALDRGATGCRAEAVAVEVAVPQDALTAEGERTVAEDW